MFVSLYDLKQLQSDTNNLYKMVSGNYSCLLIICLHSFKYSNQLLIIFKQICLTPIDGTLTDTTTLDQCGPDSNGKRLLHTLQSSKTGASPLTV